MPWRNRVPGFLFHKSISPPLFSFLSRGGGGLPEKALRTEYFEATMFLGFCG